MTAAIDFPAPAPLTGDDPTLVTAANFPVTPLVGDDPSVVALALRPKQFKCHEQFNLRLPDTRTSSEFASACRATLTKNGMDASLFNFVEKPLHEQHPGLPFGTPSVVWMGINPWCYRQDLNITGSSTHCSPLFEVDWVWDTVLRGFPGCRKRDVITDDNTILQHGVYVQGADLDHLKGISRILQLCDSRAMLIHLGDEWTNNVDGPWKKKQGHPDVPNSVYKGDPAVHDSAEKGLYFSPSFPIIVRQYWNKGARRKAERK